jgi:bifunctional DNase/RNase
MERVAMMTGKEITNLEDNLARILPVAIDCHMVVAIMAALVVATKDNPQLSTYDLIRSACTDWHNNKLPEWNQLWSKW